MSITNSEFASINNVEFVGSAGSQCPRFTSGYQIFSNPAKNIYTNRYVADNEMSFWACSNLTERKLYSTPYHKNFWYFESSTTSPMLIPSDQLSSTGNGNYIQQLWTSGRSIGCWIRILPTQESDVGDMHLIRCNSTTTETFGWGLRAADNGSGGIDGIVKLQFHVKRSTTDHIVITNDPVFRYGSTSDFQYIVLGYNISDNTTKIWLNGSLITSTVSSTGVGSLLIDTNTDITFGSSILASVADMPYQVIGMHIYSRLLTDIEVERNYVNFSRHFN